jgi:hypothetical protein
MEQFNFFRKGITDLELNATEILVICNTIILPLGLYRCETWSFKSMKEHRFRVFENRVLRRIFGPNREEEARGWRRIHNEESHNCILRTTYNVDACAPTSILPSLSLMDMIYCIEDTKATLASVQGVGVDF